MRVRGKGGELLSCLDCSVKTHTYILPKPPKLVPQEINFQACKFNNDRTCDKHMAYILTTQ